MRHALSSEDGFAEGSTSVRQWVWGSHYGHDSGVIISDLVWVGMRWVVSPPPHHSHQVIGAGGSFCLSVIRCSGEKWHLRYILGIPLQPAIAQKKLAKRKSFSHRTDT